ncbi:hypothetical protein [Nostoc sp. 'Peltigera membranacea cyanobiont' 232]|uniref:hypothetical protein n=1 Tax=Nostoc sp. 'Peltigera membranacea cyanobiont' 232 TaxID=2014531 RepID=UPI001CB9D701|nr:hypothetical protein [Nostoc sp. 'Peltigera membranacea cyanobiont' 232]
MDRIHTAAITSEGKHSFIWISQLNTDRSRNPNTQRTASCLEVMSEFCRWYVPNGTKKSRNPCGLSSLQLLA